MAAEIPRLSKCLWEKGQGYWYLRWNRLCVGLSWHIGYAILGTGHVKHTHLQLQENKNLMLTDSTAVWWELLRGCWLNPAIEYLVVCLTLCFGDTRSNSAVLRLTPGSSEIISLFLVGFGGDIWGTWGLNFGHLQASIRPNSPSLSSYFF